MNFEQLEVDPVDGAETVRLLGLSDVDLVDPVGFSKVKDIIDFLKGAVDKKYVINLVANSRPFKNNSDKINHMWNYIELKKGQIIAGQQFSKIKEEYDNANSKIKEIERNLSIFEK